MICWLALNATVQPPLDLSLLNKKKKSTSTGRHTASVRTPTVGDEICFTNWCCIERKTSFFVEPNTHKHKHTLTITRSRGEIFFFAFLQNLLYLFIIVVCLSVAWRTHSLLRFGSYSDLNDESKSAKVLYNEHHFFQFTKALGYWGFLLFRECTDFLWLSLLLFYCDRK